MSETSTLRLNLEDGEFLISLRKVGEGLKKTSDQGEKGFRKLGKGVEAAKKAVSDLGGKLKSAVGAVGALGGALSAMEGGKRALQLDATYRQLAFSVETATQKQTESVEIQRIVQDAAQRTARTSEEMAGAFAEVFGATKDLEFTKGVLKTIGTTATGTGKSVADLATVAQQMQRKFGLSAEQVEGAMAKVWDQTNQGGPSLEGLSAIMDDVGATMLRAGLDGEKGLGFLLGALNATDGAMGGLGQQVAGLKQLMTKLGDPNQIKAIGEAAGISSKELFEEKDAVARIMRIFKQGEKGMKALRKQMPGAEESDALRILFTKPFETALQAAKENGLKGKDAIEQSIRVLEGQIGDFGKSATKFSDIQEEAAEQAKAPQANMRKAMESLTQAMAQPEIIDAINELSKQMPMLAQMFGNVISFAAKNPILAGALGMGGRVGASFFAGAAREAGKELVGKFGSQLTSHAATFATTAGSKLAAAAGTPFGKLAGVAIAGAVAMAVKKAIDDQFNESQEGQRADIAAAVGGGRPTNEKERKAAIEKAKARLTELEKPRGSFDILMGGLTGTNEETERHDATRRQLLHDRIAELETMSFGGSAPAPPAAAPAAAAAPKKVSLDNQAPHLIAAAVVNGLKGTTLTVATSTHGGVPAAAVGRGPRMMPAVQQGGGL